MVFLDELVSVLDAEFSFYKGEDRSVNGLQVEGGKDVKNVAFACDASLATITDAVKHRADFLLVHHGLFWKSDIPEKVTGALRARLKAALDGGLSVYAMHLPLDAHPFFGNNILLAQKIGVKDPKPAIAYKGADIAFAGGSPVPTLEALMERVQKSFGPARVFALGPKKIRRVAVCTGSGGFCVKSAKELGFEALVTGEFNHANYHDALEHCCSVLALGHYATETLGVAASGAWLERKFGVKTVFLDHPTGL